MPRVGETIRLSNGAQDPALTVEHVVWMEAEHKDADPMVIILVRPHDGPHGA